DELQTDSTAAETRHRSQALLRRSTELQLESSLITAYSTNALFTGEGTAINSGKYNGLPTAEFKKQITHDLHKQGLGREAVNYRLRDWLFSRQRYWGEPFPIWHELDENGNLT